MNIRFRLFLMLALLATSIGARAESVRTDHIEAELIAENTALKPGEIYIPNNDNAPVPDAKAAPKARMA